MVASAPVFEALLDIQLDCSEKMACSVSKTRREMFSLEAWRALHVSPLKTNMEPKNHPISKEKHLPIVPMKSGPSYLWIPHTAAPSPLHSNSSTSSINHWWSGRFAYSVPPCFPRPQIQPMLWRPKRRQWWWQRPSPHQISPEWSKQQHLGKSAQAKTIPGLDTLQLLKNQSISRANEHFYSAIYKGLRAPSQCNLFAGEDCRGWDSPQILLGLLHLAQGLN